MQAGQHTVSSPGNSMSADLRSLVKGFIQYSSKGVRAFSLNDVKVRLKGACGADCTTLFKQTQISRDLATLH